MSMVEINPFSVMERFPDRKDAIKRLFRESESFQSMCEDYRRCTEALRYWGQSASKEAPARREEYVEILGDLEAAILLDLNELK
jgi:hypothetical protein